MKLMGIYIVDTAMLYIHLADNLYTDNDKFKDIKWF